MTTHTPWGTSPLPPDMTEAAFTTRCIDAARYTGWLVTHFRPALRQSGRINTAIQGHTGFPDLVLAKAGIAIFAELKTDKKGSRLRPEQHDWLDALAPNIVLGPGPQHLAEHATTTGLQPGHHYTVVWRPSDWPHIMATLTAPHWTSP